jgi:hypothetical protein
MISSNMRYQSNWFLVQELFREMTNYNKLYHNNDFEYLQYFIRVWRLDCNFNNIKQLNEVQRN